MAAAEAYGCFELATLFASPLQRKQNDASTFDSRRTALVTIYIAKAASPRSTGNDNKPAANYEPVKVTNCAGYSTLCPISDPVDKQSQLESISPPVGRPTTCIVTSSVV